MHEWSGTQYDEDLNERKEVTRSAEITSSAPCSDASCGGTSQQIFVFGDQPAFRLKCDQCEATREVMRSPKWKAHFKAMVKQREQHDDQQAWEKVRCKFSFECYIKELFPAAVLHVVESREQGVNQRLIIFIVCFLFSFICFSHSPSLSLSLSQQERPDDWRRRCKSKCKSFMRKRCGSSEDTKGQCCGDCAAANTCFVCGDPCGFKDHAKSKDRGRVCKSHKERCVQCGESIGKYGETVKACTMCSSESSFGNTCCFLK